jgi:hypothetical protein
MSAPLTPDETAALDAWIATALARDARGACVRCGTPMTAKRQVGRCIYVEPCGCRLGQGRLTDDQGRRVARITYPQEGQA